MKRLCAACLILVLLLGVSLTCGRALGELTETCTAHLQTAQSLAARGDWDGARARTGLAFQLWQRHSLPLHALTRHTEADQILISFRCVEQYLTLEEMDQYAAANVTLITQLELLAEMEQATLENVL